MLFNKSTEINRGRQNMKKTDIAEALIPVFNKSRHAMIQVVQKITTGKKPLSSELEEELLRITKTQNRNELKQLFPDIVFVGEQAASRTVEISMSTKQQSGPFIKISVDATQTVVNHIKHLKDFGIEIEMILRS